MGIRSLFRRLGYYADMASGFHQILRAPLPSDWDGLIRNQLHRREAAFLDTVRTVIFSDPGHPYHQMFRLAGCGYQDLQEAVRQKGLEAVLGSLRRDGVYLTHDEFKGKTPIVRAGRHIPSDQSSFANPLVTGKFVSTSGGSRSRGTTTPQNPAHALHILAYYVLNAREFELRRRRHIQVRSILPDVSGIVPCARYLRLGFPMDRWFSPTGLGRDSTHYRIATNNLVILARLRGVKIPFPSYLPPNDFSAVALWIDRRRREGEECVVFCTVSSAVRVAAAALDRGLDLRGMVFLVSSEPITDPKRRVVEATGAQLFPRYAITEVGHIGYGCRHMTTGNSVHIFRDSIAAITHRRPAPLVGVEVNSVLLTTLLACSPNVLINADMDDQGVIEPARCDCAFSAAGFTEKISEISSVGKLTGLGMTLVGSDVVRILEEVLPARFGGLPTDYQLVEKEGGLQTQLCLRVSPRVRLSSPDRVKEVFLRELEKLHGGPVAMGLLRQFEGLEVSSAEPFVTGAGKVLSLYLLGAHPEQRDGP